MFKLLWKTKCKRENQVQKSAQSLEEQEEEASKQEYFIL
jgi:hypothetical protein